MHAVLAHSLDARRKIDKFEIISRSERIVFLVQILIPPYWCRIHDANTNFVLIVTGQSIPQLNVRSRATVRSREDTLMGLLAPRWFIHNLNDITSMIAFSPAPVMPLPANHSDYDRTQPRDYSNRKRPVPPPIRPFSS
jgi:hypothetical protein